MGWGGVPPGREGPSASCWHLECDGDACRSPRAEATGGGSPWGDRTPLVLPRRGRNWENWEHPQNCLLLRALPGPQLARRLQVRGRLVAWPEPRHPFHQSPPRHVLPPTPPPSCRCHTPSRRRAAPRRHKGLSRPRVRRRARSHGGRARQSSAAATVALPGPASSRAAPLPLACPRSRPAASARGGAAPGRGWKGFVIARSLPPPAAGYSLAACCVPALPALPKLGETSTRQSGERI